ncbi:hypothetical protein PNQ92_11140 [Halobacterium salinarum]|uniref:helix-turn-helix transcriptional regulator n=1 Tax=Halobacterium salinarum TaxID=2242 RepID=UPI002555E85D|nr:hypothetical protein [Halobacterium salinarum]MDL0125960.1 hypothetical protein [Halobacterium salinarum]
MTGADSMIQVVHKRLDVLRYICEQRPAKQELVDATSKSRPTIDRVIRELEEHNLVRRANGLCKPTFAGKKACDLYLGVTDSFNLLDDANGELSSLPIDTELPTSIFRDSAVFQPPDHTPYKKIEVMYDDFSEGDSLIAATPVFLSPYINQILSRGASGEMNVSLIVHEEIPDALPESKKSALFECRKSGNTVVEVDQIPEYSLFLIDERILYLTLFSDTNHLSVAIRNTSDRAIRWSKSRISEIKENATTLTAKL